MRRKMMLFAWLHVACGMGTDACIWEQDLLSTLSDLGIKASICTINYDTQGACGKDARKEPLVSLVN